jgi:hypothetical protein
VVRRLEDRIRGLCDRALATQDAREFDSIIADLQGALREHSERLRKRVATGVFKGENVLPLERRAS